MDKFRLSFSNFEYPSIKVSDLNLWQCEDHPIVDAFGNVYYFMGQLEGTEYEYQIRSLRNYDKRTSKLIQVVGGHLSRVENFGQRSQANLEVKVLTDYRVVLPDMGASKFYGVIRGQNNWNIEKDLTRSIFGLTQEELDNFLKVFSTLFQSYSEFNHKPCTTSSNRRNNICDLSRRWIPTGFPYISYAESDYWSAHISLAGFYAFISLLFHDTHRNRSYRLITENGVTKELMDLIIEANSIYSPSEIYAGRG
jgi:hypothetical protein